MNDIYEHKANKYILKYRKLLQEIVGGVKELPLTYLLRDIKYMIEKIKNNDEKIYEKFKKRVHIPMTLNTHSIDQLKIMLEPLLKYTNNLYQALLDLIKAFNNSKLYSYNLPEFTEFPILIDLDELPYIDKFPEKSINTNMLNIFLKRIEEINEFNENKVRNKYYTELTKLRFNPTNEKSEKIKQLKQFENSQIVRENREKSDQNFKYKTKTEETKTEEEKSEEEFFGRLGINYLLHESFKYNKRFNLIQIYHNFIIKELQKLELYDFIKLFSKDIKTDKDLIDIYINNIEDRLTEIDNLGLEASRINSYREILETKLVSFQVQREKYDEQEEKYYNDIYEVFNNLTDLVMYQKQLNEIYSEYN